MSVLSINHNLPAARTANNLTNHYGKLATSTQRLSTGLRINSAADDAAGLAIRELQRADIAALRQGARNANDAISMIQIFDGAMSVIDEKLIRMKELAEQASTGTYNSTQRLMIDSEFQAMAAEINRIARATDFNGIKLINGEFDPAPDKITGADGNTYDVTLTGSFIDALPSANATQNGVWDTSGITEPDKLVGNKTITISNSNTLRIDGHNFVFTNTANINTPPPDGTSITIEYLGEFPAPGGTTTPYFSVNGTSTPAVSSSQLTFTLGGVTYNASLTDENGNIQNFNVLTVNSSGTMTAQSNPQAAFSASEGALTMGMNGNTITMELDLGNNNKITQSWDVTNGDIRALSEITINLNVVDTTPQPGDPGENGIPDNVVKIHFGTMNDSAEDYYYINKHDATTKGLGLEGVDIKTQQKAQEALVKVDSAIVAKDKIRAEYGAMQNRLENTITNIKTQAENLAVSESRISDVDVAAEMTSFVRNQVLTQSAVAMLGQANMMPQIVMRLING